MTRHVIVLLLLVFPFSIDTLASDRPQYDNIEQIESYSCDWPDTESDEDDWHFLDCVHTPVDCNWLAIRCGYDYYRSIHRGHPCGSRVYHRYACYGG